MITTNKDLSPHDASIVAKMERRLASARTLQAMRNDIRGPVAMAGAVQQSQVSARQLWKDAIARCRGEGLNQAESVRAANRRWPGLREAMLNEVNGRESQPQGHATATPTATASVVPQASARERWLGAIERLQAEGMSRSNAVFEAAKRWPGLREAMVAETNEQRRRRRR